MRLTFLAIAAFALVAVPAFAQAPQGKLAKKDAANTLTPAERKAGWRLLFDGKSTKGWRGYRKQEVPAGWRVEEGALVRADKGGDIVTEDQFSDFELVADWRISAKGNSGIIYRATEEHDQVWKTGPEYQVLDDQGHPDAKAGKEGTHKAGALYDMYPPAKDVVKPAGEWNSSRLVVKGNKVEHWLNGEKIVDVEIGSEDWKKRLAGSKWAQMATWAKPTRGHIALQDHGDKVEFRNIKILDLANPPQGAAKKK